MQCRLCLGIAPKPLESAASTPLTLANTASQYYLAEESVLRSTEHCSRGPVRWALRSPFSRAVVTSMPSIEEIPLDAKSAPTSSGQPESTAKPIPRVFKQYKNLQFTYSPSADGVDTNLLILLHGRGEPERASAARIRQAMAAAEM